MTDQLAEIRDRYLLSGLRKDDETWLVDEVTRLREIVFKASNAAGELKLENERLRSALRKVPIVRLTDDELGWQCVGCDTVAGITPDGDDIYEKCKPDCWADRVDRVLHEASEQQAPSHAPIILRFRWAPAGNHVHVRVFAGTYNTTLANVGRLHMTREEWDAFRNKECDLSFVPEGSPVGGENEVECGVCGALGYWGVDNVIIFDHSPACPKAPRATPWKA